MIERIHGMYFSPTDTTKIVVCEIVNEIYKGMDGEIIINNIDFTLPETRKKPLNFGQKDMVVIGVPVYAGRVPNILLKYLNNMVGSNTLSVPIVLYGNRNYDDALIELKDILKSRGFKTIAGGAFIGEHSFSKTLAKNRPDEKDMSIVRDFANKIHKKIKMGKDEIQMIDVKGDRPYRKYYMPKDKEDNAVDIRKVKPKTNSNCIDCKLCAKLCPMGSINYKDVSKLDGICIKCGACIKKCPANAKYFDDRDYLRHKYELEVEFSNRREPELFL